MNCSWQRTTTNWMQVSRNGKTRGPAARETNQWQVKLIKTITREEKQDRGREETQHGTQPWTSEQSSSSTHVKTEQNDFLSEQNKQQLSFEFKMLVGTSPLKQQSWSLSCVWCWRPPCNSTVLASGLSPPLKRTTQSGPGPLSKK